MAALNFTSQQRQDVYRLMFHINRSFHLIVQRLDEVGRLRIVRPKELREIVGLTQEVQLEVNLALIDPLRPLEEHDLAQFGKVRIALEKSLRDPNDVFLHAKERRKELTKQGKKSSRK